MKKLKLIALFMAFLTASLFLFACDRTLTTEEVKKIFEKFQTAVETEKRARVGFEDKLKNISLSSDNLLSTNLEITFNENKTQLFIMDFEYDDEIERYKPTYITKYYVFSDNKYKLLESEQSEAGMVWGQKDCDKDEGYEIYQNEIKRFFLLKDHLEKFEIEGDIKSKYILKDEHLDFVKELLEEENQLLSVTIYIGFDYQKRIFNVKNALSMQFYMEYIKEDVLCFKRLTVELGITKFELPQVGSPYQSY